MGGEGRKGKTKEKKKRKRDSAAHMQLKYRRNINT